MDPATRRWCAKGGRGLYGTDVLPIRFRERESWRVRESTFWMYLRLPLPNGSDVISATSNFATMYHWGPPRSRAAPNRIKTPPLEITHAPKEQRPRSRPAPGYIGGAISVLSIRTSADLIGAATPRTCAKVTCLSRSSPLATKSDMKWAMRTAQRATTSANAVSTGGPDAISRRPLYVAMYFFFFRIGVWYSCECGLVATILGLRDAPPCGFFPNCLPPSACGVSSN